MEFTTYQLILTQIMYLSQIKNFMGTIIGHIKILGDVIDQTQIVLTCLETEEIYRQNLISKFGASK